MTQPAPITRISPLAWALLALVAIPAAHALALRHGHRLLRAFASESLLDRLAGTLQLKGHTLVPLKLYLTRGKIKLELGLGKGKLLFDKRETLRRKTDEREAAREMRR